MSFTSTVTSLVTAETQTLRELPMPEWAFGVMAFGSLLLLLVVLWCFRNTASKYDIPVVAAHGGVEQSGDGSHAATDHGAHH